MKPFLMLVIFFLTNVLVAQQPLSYEKLNDFKNGYALVEIGNKKGFIDVNGNLIGKMDVSQYKLPNDGTSYQGKSIYINQKHGDVNDGVRNFNGDFVIEPKYNIQPWNSFFILNDRSLANFMKPVTYQVINDDGKIIYKLTNKKANNETFFPLSDELIGIQNLEKNNFYYAVMSLTSDYKTDYVYKQFSTLQNGFIKAQRYSENDGKLKWGFLNDKGEEVIEFIYTAEPSDFSNNKAVVKNTKGLFGYVDSSNKIVLEPNYIEAYSFVNDKALVKIHNVKVENKKKNFGYRLIDSNGKILFDLGEFSPKRYYGVNNYNVVENGSLILLKSNTKTYLFNIDDLAIKELPYFSVGRYDSNRALVTYRKDNSYVPGYADENGDLIFYAEMENQF